jgi:NAD kinase
MERISERKMVLVTRKTRLADLIVRFNSESQARFYVEHLGADFEDYRKENEEYLAAVAAVKTVLQRFGRVHPIDRSYLPNFIFGKDDLIISVGQDGLVANTLKYLDGNGLIGVNPSPSRWDGVLLPFGVGDLERILPEAIRNRRPTRKVTMAEARLNDGQSLVAVNDLFIGQKSHVSARYGIEYAGAAENHSSSGIIVSTGLGSTGWMKSVMAGSVRITAAMSNQTAKWKEEKRMAWDSDFLRFSVREPFPSKTTGTDLVFGKVTKDKPLNIRSLMAENGVIFSDGVESDFLEFNSGKIASIGISEKQGLLVQ